MKKALILCALIVSMPCAFAYIEAEKQTTAEYMKNAGWSSATIDVVEKSKRQTNSNTASEKPVSDITPNSPQWEQSTKWEKFKHYYGKLRLYWDPMANDPDFGEKDIRFGNHYDCL